MNAIELFRVQINASREIVQGTVADLTQELSDHKPEGTAHPIGACYAHLLTTEDFIVSMVLRRQQPLMMGELAGKSGMSAPPPGPGGDQHAWATSVKVDLGRAQEYAKAVYKATDDYLGTLSPEDLDEEIDVPGFGKNTRAWLIGTAALIHPANHVGEISALKGVQGARGYPF